MSQLTTLYQLQSVEQQITDVNARLQEIDQILKSDAAIEAANKRVAAAQGVLTPLQKKSKELEHEFELVSNKAQETETRLYGGTVKNPKEMQDMQQELGLLRQRQSELEDRVLALMDEIDAAESNLTEAQAVLEQTKRSRAAENEALLLEQDAKNKALQRLHGESQGIAAAVDDAALKLYESLKPRTRGNPIAIMKSDATCSLCGVQQNRTDENKVRRCEVVQCNNCRRILILR